MAVRAALGEIAIASAAGVLATKAMEQVGMQLYALEPEADRKREDEVRPGPPYRIAAQKMLGALGLRPTSDELERIGLIFHYGLGISWVPVHAVLRRALRISPILAGLISGATMSLLIDEGMTPMLGFSAPNNAYPRTTRLRGFASHLAFGLAVAAVTEAGWAMSARLP
jgi:hypothetical protein